MQSRKRSRSQTVQKEAPAGYCRLSNEQYGTPRGRSNGPAFVLGWIAGLAVAGTVVLLVSSGADASEGGAPPGR